MSSIVTCECGASIRLPENRENRQFRCPKCKTGIALALGDLVLHSQKLQRGDEGYVCQICHTQIGPEEGFVSCPKCEQVAHRECWSEIGGCGTYGCEQAPAVEKPDTSAQAPLTAWGDTKKCPACKEEIKSIAVKCRYCGTEFDSVDPMSLADLKHRGDAEDLLNNFRYFVIGTFVASLIGCLAPIVLIVAAVGLMTQREKLTKAGPLYVVMGYASLFISIAFTILGVVLFLAEMVGEG